MKIAVTGHRGYIGEKLIKSKNCVPLECDILNEAGIQSALYKVKPDVVIHCAGKTDVDWCEKNPGQAFDVNARGTNNLVSCLDRDQLLVYISTYHIFNGKRLGLLGGYTERHESSPVNIYGITKVGGEMLARMGVCKSLVIRTGKLFDYSRIKPKLDSILNDPLPIAHPINGIFVRSYLHLTHFVEMLLDCVNEHEKIENGIINLVAGTDLTMTEYDFWRYVFEHLGVAKDISKRTKLDEELGYKVSYAPRPVRGGLDGSKLHKLDITYIPTLEDALQCLLDEMEGEYETEL